MSQASVKAGSAYVEIGIKNRINAGAKGVQSDLDRLGRKVTALGSIMTGLGTTLGLPFAFAAGKLASFDDAMRSVGAISQATEKDLAMLTDTAKELGRTTSFTAVDVANLMTELGRAGFDPTQVNEMTSAVLNLSRATGTEAAMSAGILAATIRQYNLAAGDAASVSDALTAAANKSFNTVESLGEALSYAGPVAADFGVTMEETLAILGTLGNVGIQGSNAGTAIRRLLTLTGAEAERLQGIFGVAFVDAAGNARPLIDTLGEVAEATNGLGTATRAAKFSEAFGLLGITAASAMGSATTSTKELLAEIQSAEGIAADTAEKMDAGLGGSFRKIMSAAEGAAIAIAETFGNSLQGLTDTMTANIGAFTEWVQENQSLVSAVAATTVGLVAVGASLWAVGAASSAAAAGIGTLISTTTIASGAMAGLSAATAVAKSITLVTAGTFAAASASSSAMATGIALVNAAYAASPIAAGLAVSAWSAVGATLTALSAPSALAVAAAGALGAAWTSAAGLVATAWAVITGPIFPFIAAGAAAVAVVGALVGAAGYAAIAGMDFGRAWKIAGDTLNAIASTVSDAFEVIRSALGSGDYATAAQALWLGVQAVFWDGVEGVMKAFSWLWDESIATGKRFFSSLLSIAWRAAKAIASAIISPFQAAREIGTLIGELAGSVSGFSASDRSSAAKQELTALRESLAIEKEREKLRKDADKVREESKSHEEVKAEKLAKVDLLRRAGGLTDEEAEQARKKINESQPELSDPAKDKVNALELEILALEKGEDAADRKRLADEGLTESDIKQIEALKAKKKAIEEAQEAEKNASQRRADDVLARGDKLSQAGVSPHEVFKQVMNQLASDESSGKINSETAGQARETARGNLDDQIESLKAEGRAMADALRTPAEVLSGKLREISQLQDAGAINEETALRAEDQARKEFADEQERNKEKVVDTEMNIQEELSRSGPSGTFSAAAAMIIGGGSSIESENLKANQKIAENTTLIAKEAKKKNIARFQ